MIDKFIRHSINQLKKGQVVFLFKKNQVDQIKEEFYDDEYFLVDKKTSDGYTIYPMRKIEVFGNKND